MNTFPCTTARTSSCSFRWRWLATQGVSRREHGKTSMLWELRSARWSESHRYRTFLPNTLIQCVSISIESRWFFIRENTVYFQKLTWEPQIFREKASVSWCSYCIAHILMKGASIVQTRQAQNALLLSLDNDRAGWSIDLEKNLMLSLNNLLNSFELAVSV